MSKLPIIIEVPLLVSLLKDDWLDWCDIIFCEAVGVVQWPGETQMQECLQAERKAAVKVLVLIMDQW